MDTREDYDYFFNVIVIGNMNVGKSAIVQRFTEGFCSSNYQATIGVDFRVKTVKIDFNVIKLQIWDTAGAERFDAITRQFYRQADIVMICFDLTNQKSFDDVPRWLESVQDHAHREPFKILIGNKKDLHEHRVIQSKQGQNCVGMKIIDAYVETSAFDEKTVEQVFKVAAAEALLRRTKHSELDDNMNGTLPHGMNLKEKKRGIRKCCN